MMDADERKRDFVRWVDECHAKAEWLRAMIVAELDQRDAAQQERWEALRDRWEQRDVEER